MRATRSTPRCAPRNNRLIAANATGCLEVFSTPYPESSWQLPWMHSLFGNAPAVATGIAAALRVKGRSDVRVVGQAGDGGTVDIGMGCLSGMFERNDDVLFICYDNEGYMNTGVQRSGATPPGARTATTEAVGPRAGEPLRPGQERAADRHGARDPVRGDGNRRRSARHRVQGRARHDVPWGAVPAHPRDLSAGWGCDSADTVRVARLAAQSGLFPVFEAEHGEVTAVTKIRHQVPVEEYLKLQRRYAHLFGSAPRPDIVARIQARADHNIARFGLLERICGRSPVMEQAICDHPERRVEPRQQTGSWRTERAVYVHRLPPCADACPAGENVQQWLYRAEAPDYEAAWRQIMEDNPFPAVMGRVCYHPCETSCNRAQLDQPVGINSVERFLGDEAIKRGWTVPVMASPSGKRVMVVGAGPSGLSAAYHLTLLGHAVTIFDSGPVAGGMMRFGIPKYRLPRDVLDAEIRRILDMGVTLTANHTVTDVRATMAEGRFDAAFLSIGAQIGKRAYIPAGNSAHILDAVALLRSMEGEEPPMLGRRVVVYGGGNTAMDVARTAKRLGATESIVVYRRTRERMPAHDFEVEEALDEGVTVKWLSTIAHAAGGRLRLERMELDAAGFPQPTGEFEELDADSLVLAVGQEADLSLLDGLPGVETEDHVVKVGPNMMTGYPGIFAGGDMVPAERTVTVGVGHGKKAARHIDAWLRQSQFVPPPKHELATFEQLNPWYYSDAPATVRPQLDAARRRSTFDEVVGGLDEHNALFEARRCLSCGNCFACDNCYGVCPDNAVVKLDPGNAYGYEIDLNYCKGCGLCVAECPCGALEMVPETI